MDDWKTEVSEFYKGLENKATRAAEQQNQELAAVHNFFSNIVAPAFAELKTGFEQLGRKVETSVASDSASISIFKEEKLEYELKIRTNGNRVYPVLPINVINAQSISTPGGFKKDFREMTKGYLVQSFLTAYKQFLSHHSS